MVVVNKRDEVAWEEGLTVSRLLDQLRFTFPQIIVSIDGELVRREEYATRVIPDAADVRVVHLMAGG
jgi:sulfur carrier protein